MFLPGETVIHEFVIPMIPSNATKIYVTYKQGDKIILIKNYPASSVFTDSVTKKKMLRVALSQAESLLFQSPDSDKTYDYVPFTVQLNIATSTGSRMASVPLEGRTGIQHLREVVS